MIPIFLYDFRWRVVALVLVAWVFFLLEPGFHQHDPASLPSGELGPVGVSASLSYFSAIAMIVLLAGFVSGDRREGYGRILFSHPVHPLALYGLKIAVALAIALAGSALFLTVGQIVAWGGVRGGWSGLLLALVSALVYGGLMTFLSAALDRGGSFIAFLMFLPTFAPQLFALGFGLLPDTMRTVLLLLLPPQGAFENIWNGLIDGYVAWGSVAFAGLYAVIWGAAGAVLIRSRDIR